MYADCMISCSVNDGPRRESASPCSPRVSNTNCSALGNTPLGGEPAVTSSNPPFVPCSAWWPCARWNHCSHFPGDAPWFWLQPAPGPRSAAGGSGASMGRWSQFLQILVMVGWTRDRPTVATLNLLAFVGLSQSFNVT